VEPRIRQDVRNGREVVITERGRPVARLVPVKPLKPFPNLASVRRRMPRVEPSLSQAELDDRDERL
jgi:antitoxin (DNA-binding transcriptional repressor) of toxin-antitoxin stability system